MEGSAAQPSVCVCTTCSGPTNQRTLLLRIPCSGATLAMALTPGSPEMTRSSLTSLPGRGLGGARPRRCRRPGRRGRRTSGEYFRKHNTSNLIGLPGCALLPVRTRHPRRAQRLPACPAAHPPLQRGAPPPRAPCRAPRPGASCAFQSAAASARSRPRRRCPRMPGPGTAVRAASALHRTLFCARTRWVSPALCLLPVSELRDACRRFFFFRALVPRSRSSQKA